MDYSFLNSQIQMAFCRVYCSLFEKFSQNITSNNSQITNNSSSTAPAKAVSETSSSTYSPTSSQGNFADLINEAAQRYGVNPQLVQAVIKAESNFNPSAVSSAGALGLMQLMPATASSLGVSDPLNPAQNIDGGVHFLSQLMSHYNGNVKLALAAYNAGPGAVDRYQDVPPYQETQLYVNRIMSYLESNNQWKG
jgi:soluble lytic murein transglycosylase-like protein